MLDAVQSNAIVLHGPTSSGKSSIARALQASSPVPAFPISLDAFVTMANRGDMRSEEERERAYRIHCENLRSTLARVVDTEFDIILDLVLRDVAGFDACLRCSPNAQRMSYAVGLRFTLSTRGSRIATIEVLEWLASSLSILHTNEHTT
jgi:chloramphenicol 3-O phosphotransferase